MDQQQSTDAKNQDEAPALRKREHRFIAVCSMGRNSAIVDRIMLVEGKTKADLKKNLGFYPDLDKVLRVVRGYDVPFQASHAIKL